MVNMAGNNRQTSSNKMSKFNWTNELVNDLMIYENPSKFLTKVFDAGLHGQKTLTKFLIENFDRVNGALHIT
jgi:hypothetical protein